jgi:hypothetical protein
MHISLLLAPAQCGACVAVDIFWTNKNQVSDIICGKYQMLPCINRLCLLLIGSYNRLHDSKRRCLSGQTVEPRGVATASVHTWQIVHIPMLQGHFEAGRQGSDHRQHCTKGERGPRTGCTLPARHDRMLLYVLYIAALYSIWYAYMVSRVHKPHLGLSELPSG